MMPRIVKEKRSMKRKTKAARRRASTIKYRSYRGGNVERLFGCNELSNRILNDRWNYFFNNNGILRDITFVGSVQAGKNDLLRTLLDDTAQNLPNFNAALKKYNKKLTPLQINTFNVFKNNILECRPPANVNPNKPTTQPTRNIRNAQVPTWKDDRWVNKSVYRRDVEDYESDDESDDELQYGMKNPLPNPAVDSTCEEKRSKKVNECYEKKPWWNPFATFASQDTIDIQEECEKKVQKMPCDKLGGGRSRKHKTHHRKRRTSKNLKKY